MKSVLRVENLRFNWGSGQPDVLDIPTLSVARGERLFVSGPSGSGKSTLLSLLAGVMTPQHGVVEIIGQRIDEMSGNARDHFRADHVGYIFQMFNLIPYLSLIDNVTLPLFFSMRRRAHVARLGHGAEQEARRLLSHIGLGDDRLLGRKVTELSVGQQQRVAAARSLIGAPQLLIADEPTSALDHAHRAAFIDLLFRECDEQNTTLLFVSHDQTLGEMFNRRVNMAEINHAMPVAA